MQTHAWTLTLYTEKNYGGQVVVIDGEADQSVTLKTSYPNFDKTGTTQVGFSCPSWHKPSLIRDNAITAFEVTDC
ncbi:24199_t:CDS:2 [Entrophospora sp. SA101]|nr:24199_t:CDS:2 [Entrophospora sp. SA101]